MDEFSLSHGSYDDVCVLNLKCPVSKFHTQTPGADPQFPASLLYGYDTGLRSHLDSSTLTRQDCQRCHYVPNTTACFPARGTFVNSNNLRTPAGVHGKKRGSEARDDKCPILYA